MNIDLYGSKRVWFADRGWVVVCHVPCPQEPYGAQLEDQEGEPVKAWGKTPLEAIAALEALLIENEQ
jgi:hypothetical protein